MSSAMVAVNGLLGELVLEEIRVQERPKSLRGSLLQTERHEIISWRKEVEGTSLYG